MRRAGSVYRPLFIALTVALLSISAGAQSGLEDPGCNLGSGMTTGRTQYHVVKHPDGKCFWEVDEDSMRCFAQKEAQRAELFWALRSRVLTDKEMAEVTQYGDTLNIRDGELYSEAEKMREMNDALLQQQRLRAVPKKKP